MNASVPGFAPLGRLYDPLVALSARIRRTLAAHRMTVWSDERGGLYVSDAFLLRSMPPPFVIGTYDNRSPQWVIERDLRAALRRRASKWIVDWDVSISGNVDMEQQQTPARRLRPRGRRRMTPLDGSQI